MILYYLIVLLSKDDGMCGADLIFQKARPHNIVKSKTYYRLQKKKQRKLLFFPFIDSFCILFHSGKYSIIKTV